MKIQKLFALILAALMCACAFMACDGKNNDASKETGGNKKPNSTQATTDSEDKNESDTNGKTETGTETEEKEEVIRFDYFGATLSDYIGVDKSLYTDKNVNVNPEYEVDEEMLNKYIDSLRFKHRTKTNGDTKINASPIKFGDSAFIYYKGFRDGEEFEGGSNWNDTTPYELGIGSGSFIPGFEDGLVGLIPSDTSKDKPFELNVTFPENYGSDLAGAAVVFHVYVEYIVQYDLPEYDEKFILDTLKFDAETDDVVNEHNKFAWDLLKEEADYYAKQEALNTVWNDLLEKAVVIKYPEGEVDYYYDSYIDQYEYYMQMFNQYYGYSFKSLDEFVPEYLGLDKDADWKAETRTTSELDVKQNMIFHAIAQQEKITLTETDYSNSIQYYIDYYKQQYQQTYTAAQIEEMLGSRLIRENALFEKVNDFLFENCTLSYGE